MTKKAIEANAIGVVVSALIGAVPLTIHALEDEVITAAEWRHVLAGAAVVGLGAFLLFLQGLRTTLEEPWDGEERRNGTAAKKQDG